VPESFIVRSTEVAAGVPGPGALGSASPVLVTGLSNGISYSFTVAAVNRAGESPPSLPSAVVVPVAPTSTPITITSVGPGLGPGASNREVYIDGSGFPAGSQVTIAGVSVLIRRITASRITLGVSVPEAAPPGPRDVTVRAPDGTSIVRSGGFVVLPPPVVNDVSPSAWARGASFTVEILGSNFSSWGLSVAVSGTGVTVSGVVRVSASLVRASIAVASTAAAGVRTLTVRNGDQGIARSSVTLT
jgi:hypothetical protein